MASNGKPAVKLERMKHIRCKHEQFPYLMAALQTKASWIVQSFTNAGQNIKQQEYSTLISQLCSASPPVNFFVTHPGYNLSWATCWPWTCTESCRWSWTMYCLAVYHCLLLRAYQAMLPLSPGFASGILVTSRSLAALITQGTATASLRRRNASCGFRIAEPLDWEIQRHLWGAFGICIAQLTFQEQGAWSCHHKSCKSGRACKCNLHCCLPTLNSLNFTWLQLWEQVRSISLGVAKSNRAATGGSQAASGCCASIDAVSLHTMPQLKGNPLD